MFSKKLVYYLLLFTFFNSAQVESLYASKKVGQTIHSVVLSALEKPLCPIGVPFIVLHFN